MSITDRLNFTAFRRVPIILQGEVAECGLACLAMVAGYWSNHSGLSRFRQRNTITLKGMTLANLAQIAEGVGLDARAIRCDVDDLKKLRTPCILHWDLNHFVVLVKVSSRKYVIHDPAIGKRTLSEDEMSRSFTGVALELSPTNSFKKEPKTPSIRISDLWSQMSGFTGTIAKIIVLTLGVQLFSILSPLLGQIVVDEVIAKSNRTFLSVVIAAFFGLLLLRVAIEALRSWISMYFGTLLSFQMRSNLFRHLLRLKPDYFEKRHIGDVVSRVSSLEPVQDFLTKSFVIVILDGLMAAVTLAIMFAYSGIMGAIVLVVFLAIFVSRLVSFFYVLRLENERIHYQADLETLTLESIRGIRAIKIFGREPQRYAQWQSTFADTTNVSLKLERFQILSQTSKQFVSGSLEIGMYFVGALLVMDGSLTLGMFFAFQIYRLQFSERINALTNLFFEWKMVELHLDRIADIVRAEREADDAQTSLQPISLTGEIKVDSLSFRYGDTEPLILQDVDMHISQGDKVALIGPSGSGKTTLLKLLIGLQLPIQGRVLFDGLTPSQIGLSNLRKQFGVVMQDDRLMSGSLMDNISFFDPEVDVERVYKSALDAQIHREIMMMPMGYENLVGDMGSTLSGGQKQRIMIARALYANPHIIFLDEGTANLDSRSESNIVEILSQIPVTQVIIAHRLNAVSHCNRAFSVRDGKVCEVAIDDVLRHPELLGVSGSLDNLKSHGQGEPST